MTGKMVSKSLAQRAKADRRQIHQAIIAATGPDIRIIILALDILLNQAFSSADT